MKMFLNIIALLAVLVLPGIGQAGTYVSFAGDFYFDYPEDWIQVDHRIVDAHLLANQAGATTLDYEAAFSPAASVPFFSGPYFILTVDTTGGDYTQQEIDSTLADMGRKFGTSVRYFPVAAFLSDMKSNAPSYDAQTRTISVASDIVERGEVVKKHLLVVRFHDKGLATFYFYAPTATFAAAQPVFNQVLASFHSGGAEQALPKETLKVADIEQGKAGGDKKRSPFVFWTSVAAVLIIAIAVIRRRRRQNR